MCTILVIGNNQFAIRFFMTILLPSRQYRLLLLSILVYTFLASSVYDVDVVAYYYTRISIIGRGRLVV